MPSPDRLSAVNDTAQPVDAITQRILILEDHLHTTRKLPLQNKANYLADRGFTVDVAITDPDVKKFLQNYFGDKDYAMLISGLHAAKAEGRGLEFAPPEKKVEEKRRPDLRIVAAEPEERGDFDPGTKREMQAVLEAYKERTSEKDFISRLDLLKAKGVLVNMALSNLADVKMVAWAGLEVDRQLIKDAKSYIK
ncbi:MAG: hypothetical protein EXS55_00845 [Candidatus Magasanikbacteria bacterium]|nr:hypothetical protein [Candidatus Magasanikbacteria bacterium]